MDNTISIPPELGTTKNGLIFDAEGVTLIAKYTDQLSAYRARREWSKVFSEYFLLEGERDYDNWIAASERDDSHILYCSFTSACGRYAFWRLINQQAPEAETELCGVNLIAGSSPKSFLSNLLQGSTATERAESQVSWLEKSLNEQINRNEETSGVLKKLLKLFD